MYTLITMFRSGMLTRVRSGVAALLLLAPYFFFFFLFFFCRHFAGGLLGGGNQQQLTSCCCPRLLRVCGKAAQTICANAPVLGLWMELCIPPPPLSLRASPPICSLSISPLRPPPLLCRSGSSRRHVYARHARTGDRPDGAARQRGYIV